MKNRPTPQEPKPSQMATPGTAGRPPSEKEWCTTTAAAAMPRRTSRPGSHAPVPARGPEALAEGVALCGPLVGRPESLLDTLGVGDLVMDGHSFRTSEQGGAHRPAVVHHDLPGLLVVEERQHGIQVPQFRVADRHRETAEPGDGGAAHAGHVDGDADVVVGFSLPGEASDIYAVPTLLRRRTDDHARAPQAELVQRRTVQERLHLAAEEGVPHPDDRLVGRHRGVALAQQPGGEGGALAGVVDEDPR